MKKLIIATALVVGSGLAAQGALAASPAMGTPSVGAKHAKKHAKKHHAKKVAMHKHAAKA